MMEDKITLEEFAKMIGIDIEVKPPKDTDIPQDVVEAAAEMGER